MSQIGGGKCSLCRAEGTTMLNCPLNAKAKHPNPNKHPQAAAETKPVAKPKITLKPKSEVAVAVAKPKLILKPKPAQPEPAATAVSLEDIYLSNNARTKQRNIFKANVDQTVMQCLTQDQLLKDIKVVKRLGSGSFGIVSIGNHPRTQSFAIKQAAATGIAKPNDSDSSWSEVLILNNIVAPLIERNICPNLPLIYSAFGCNKCQFEALAGRKTFNKSCLILIMELASGDLLSWLKSKPSDAAVYSALFQIMAGLYALQKHGQVFNNDIKGENILYYNVKPGGYWKYTIHGKTYYVPNLGQLFVVNDFGVSIAFSPDYLYGTRGTSKTSGKSSQRVGSIRPYILIDKRITPLESRDSLGASRAITCNGFHYNVKQFININKGRVDFVANLTAEQRAYMTKHGLPTDGSDPRFFSNVDVVPDLYMSSDVIDAVGMFIGKININGVIHYAQRTTQQQFHTDVPVSEHIKSMLYSYIPAPNMWADAIEKSLPHVMVYSTPVRAINMPVSVVNAGYFIDDFFGSNVSGTAYLAPPSGPIIGDYTI